MPIPSIGWGNIPWSVDSQGLYILDANGRKLLEVRGWGRLTGRGSEGLGLSEEVASKAQEELARHVVEVVNNLSLPLRELRKKVFKDRIREAIRETKKAAVAVKDDGTGRAIMAINEEEILNKIL